MTVVQTGVVQLNQDGWVVVMPVRFARERCLVVEELLVLCHSWQPSVRVCVRVG